MSIRDPNELLIACNKAELSTDKPEDVICTGVDDIETGEENLPSTKSGSESTSNKSSPVLPFFEGGVAQSEAVDFFECGVTDAAAAAAEDMHKGKIKGTLRVCDVM